MSKYFISCYNEQGEMSHFEVPKPVYIYIKQMEAHIKQGGFTGFAGIYADRITVYKDRPDEFKSGYIK